MTRALSQAYVLIVSELHLNLFGQNLIEFIVLVFIVKAESPDITIVCGATAKMCLVFLICKNLGCIHKSCIPTALENQFICCPYFKLVVQSQLQCNGHECTSSLRMWCSRNEVVWLRTLFKVSRKTPAAYVGRVAFYKSGHPIVTWLVEF